MKERLGLMKVNIKIKHLIMTVISLVVFLLVFNIYIYPKWENWLIDRDVANGNMSGAKDRLLSNLDRNSNSKYDFIRDHIITTAPEMYDVYIGPSSQTGSGYPKQILTLKEAVPYLQDYIQEAPADEYIVWAAKSLVSYFKRNGNRDEGDQVLEAAVNRFTQDNSQYHELWSLRIEESAAWHEFEEVEELITKYERHMDETFMDPVLRIAKVKGEMLAKQGRKEDALNELDKGIEYYDNWLEEIKEQFSETDNFEAGESHYYHELREYRTFLLAQSENTDLATVEGQLVKSNGEPLVNVGVFLRNESKSNHSFYGDGRYETVTSHDGSFRISNVLPGSYQVYLGLMFDQVDGYVWATDPYDIIDIEGEEVVEYPIEFQPLINIVSPSNYVVIKDEEVTFTWEEVPNADYYVIQLGVHFDGGSIYSSPNIVTKDQEVSVPVEILYDHTMGITHKENWDKEYLDTESLLAFLNVEGTFSWQVHALDETGKLISKSNGYRLTEDTMSELPFFHLQERTMTEADLVLQDGDIEKAYNMYKENIENEIELIHSLRMIIRLDNTLDKESDALPYLLMLGEKHPTPSTLSSLVRYYFREGGWQEFEKWFIKYEEISEDDSTYMDSLYAVFKMKQGELEEALAIFKKTMDEYSSNHYIGYILALELYLEEDWGRVEELARNYPERSFGNNPPNWLRLIQNISDLEHEIVMEGLSNYFTGDEEKTDAYLEEKDENALTIFIRALQQSR
ncbi:hypothetical protein ACERII_15200 [Evansella sp. AB-rgal1]|uniref:hypothetical protein n=1 Tax=Evansella sp. AB-rgal1 TaxID=3242696 RepID=UPI00359EA2C6